MMKLARIGSKTTYYKAMKDLHNHNFIRYDPSYDSNMGSEVHLTTFWSGTYPKTEPAPDPKMDPFNKDTNNTITIRESNFYDNQKSSKKDSQKTEEPMKIVNNNFDPQLDLFDFEETPLPGERIPKKEKRKKFKAPNLEQVQIYFEEKEQPLSEAERFYNFYECTGWLVGGTKKMKNWKAAARNWMLNIKRYEAKAKAAGKTTSTLKPPGIKPSDNFDEPL